MGLLIRCLLMAVALLAAHAPLRAQDEPLPAPAAELKALEWMLGTWKHEAEGVVLEIRCDKSPGGYFLERTFRIKLGTEADLILKQFIGWDPVTSQIRSWGFGSDGSHEEGLWHKKNNTWEIERRITFANGRKGTALNIISMIDRDTFLFKSVERLYGKLLLPDIVGLEVERTK